MSSTVTTTNGMVIFTQIFPENSPQAQELKGKSGQVNEISTANIPGHLQRFLKGEPRALGTTQIMIGITCIIFGIALAIQETTIVIYAGLPFWTSLLFIASGSVAVAASRNTNTCLVKSALALNFISAITAGISLILYIIDIAHDHMQYKKTCNDNDWHYSYYYGCSYIQRRKLSFIYSIQAIILIFTLLEFCIAVSLSIFGCKTTNQENRMPTILVQPVSSSGKG